MIDAGRAERKSATVLVNGISARRGGALMVYRALLGDLDRYPPTWRFVVIVNGAMAVSELGSNDSRLTLVEVPRRLDRAAVALQRQIVSRAAREHSADVLLCQNFLVPGIRIPQVVFHVNVFSFVANDALEGPFERIRERIRQWAANAALRRARMNVYESRYLESLARRSSDWNADRSVVLHIGIDGRGRPPKGPSAPESPPRIVVVTSDNRHKRNDWLPAIAAVLARRVPDAAFVFTIFGAGAWEGLRRAARDARVEHMFDFQGYVSGDELRDRLDGALCLVSTSAVESFCSVAVEAMARAVPAIVSRTSSMPESVGDAGILVDESDGAEGFADEIERLAGDSTYRDAVVERGLAHAATLHWSSAAERLGEILGRAIEDGAVRGRR